ncbi:MAG: hypothetical protein U1E35_06290 [Rhodospirillales bacterium]
MIFILEDVTAHRLLEQQLRHAQKMEAMGHLTGGLAHDFNNLLALLLAISTSCSIMSRPILKSCRDCS